MAPLSRLLAALPLLLGAVSAVPPPITGGTCKGPFKPTSIYVLREEFPDQVESSNVFQVAQSPGPNNLAIDRVAMFFQFEPSAPGAFACELFWQLSENLDLIDAVNVSQLDVHVIDGFFTAPTWNSVVAPGLSTLIGTVDIVAGTKAVVNTEACSSTTGLGYVFTVAQNVAQLDEAVNNEFFLNEDTSDAETFSGVFQLNSC